jgi:hypothetical protein
MMIDAFVFLEERKENNNRIIKNNWFKVVEVNIVRIEMKSGIRI